MAGACDGQVVVVTGAGRGLGRAYAHELARQGAMVVVNDLGSAVDGTGGSLTPAQEVVDEVEAIGGVAIPNVDDVADHDGARRLIESSVDAFGRVDVVINNAGILRDRTLVNMDIEEWDSVTRVHLRGTFCVSKWAAVHWRDRAKAGEALDARLINTSSSSGIYANPGQINYAAAKAGIAAMTIIASRELLRYGVTVNAVYPSARSRLTAELMGKAGMNDLPDAQLDPFEPANLAPVVVWLASPRSTRITGRVFGVRGDRVTVAEGWTAGPSATTERPWRLDDLDTILPRLVDESRPNAIGDGTRVG